MIDIQRQDARGNEIARYMDIGVIDELLKSVDRSGHCLAFIDPYGDTTFNRVQLPELLREIAELRARITDPDLESRTDDLMRFLRLALDEPHLYVKFIGD